MEEKTINLDQLGIQALQKLIEEIQYDDELREKFNQILKDTEYYIPPPKEKKVEEKVKNEIKKIEEEKEEIKTKLQALENEKKLQKAYEIMDKYNIPREMIAEVEKYARENGIQKWETACKLYALEQKQLQSLTINQPPHKKNKDLISRYAGEEGKTNLKEDLLQVYRSIVNF